MAKITTEGVIAAEDVCWTPEQVRDFAEKCPRHSDGSVDVSTLLARDDIKPTDVLWAVLNGGCLDEGTLYAFAADCAERIYPRISNFDGSRALRKAIEAARSGDSDRIAVARSDAGRFARKHGALKQPLLLCVYAIRGCTKPTGKEAAMSAAFLAAESEGRDRKEEEFVWQVNHLRTLVA